MKNLINRFIIAISVLICQTPLVNAQTNGISYQGVARTAAGNIVANQPISIRFSILQGSTTGTLVYQETHHVSTNSLGLFEVRITNGTTTGPFDPVKWNVLAGSGAYLKTELDINGGAAYIDMGTTQLLSVPFAMYSEKSGSSFGSVVYAGTWDVQNNNPALSTGVGNKGDYYVVSVAGNHALNGITDWQVGDWAIYNGTAWEKVDNSQAPVSAADVGFTPNGDIAATNVQEAIVELRDDADSKLATKQDLLGYTPVPDTRTVNGHALTSNVTVTKSDVGLGNVVDLNTSDPSNITQDATHRFVSDTEKSTWNGKQDALGFTPVPDTRTVNGHALTSNVTVTKSDVGLGNVVNLDTSDPSNITQDATHRFVTDAEKTTWNGKLNLAGGTMSGDLILNADPTVAFGAATKQYVDAADALKADKVTGGGTNGHLAALNASGNLVDAGKSPEDFLAKDNTTVYEPTANYHPATKKYVDDSNSAINGKVSKSGDTMTGDLILFANPSAALGAATKQYVDAADVLKADKVISATAGNFATLDVSGNLVDGGSKAATNISFTPTSSITASNVQAAITEVDSKFAGLIDSYIHKLDDGVSIYLPPAGTRKRFGIGNTTPESPLGISAEGTEQRVLTLSPNTLAPAPTYTFRLTATPGSPGLNLEEDNLPGGSKSRLFIEESTGYVGIGTFTPSEKLHIESSTPAGITGIKMLNTATAVNQGWSMGHVSDASVVDKDGAFSIFENTTAGGGKIERITVLPGGNMGVNELIPDTKLHVSRSVADPNSAVALIEGTGIVTIGPITNNIVADYRGIQARTGTYVGSTLSLVASELNIQRLGGDILIHGDNSIALTSKGIITEDGKLGLGTITPLEKIEIDGAIKIGTSTGTNDGTIRYTGSDFEGRKGGSWVSLTGGAGPWTSNPGNSIYYNTGSSPKVGIGVSVPVAALDVLDNDVVTAGSTASLIRNTSATSSSGSDDNRVGLEVSTSSTWGTNANAKNIGIYVKEVSGQSSPEVNLAAVLNGNVVIGDISSSNAIGTNGKNVLAIQNGVAPSSAIGSTSSGGIQIYSDEISLGALAPPFSALHIRLGNGDIVKLYRADPLTVADNSTVNPTTYGPDVQALIKNMRDRINDLELRLQAFGLLP